MVRLLDEDLSRFIFDQPKPGPCVGHGRMVDIDEQDVLSKKRCSDPMRGGEGRMNTLVYDAATGKVLAIRLDPSDVGHGTGRSDLQDDALRRLEGLGISLVRADSAYLNSGTINSCIGHGVDFMIRANLRRERKGSIPTSTTAPCSQWGPTAISTPWRRCRCPTCWARAATP